MQSGGYPHKRVLGKTKARGQYCRKFMKTMPLIMPILQLPYCYVYACVCHVPCVRHVPCVGNVK